jgi:hypothetical protein
LLANGTAIAKIAAEIAMMIRASLCSALLGAAVEMR